MLKLIDWKKIIPVFLVLQSSLASDLPAYARKHHQTSESQAQVVTTGATIALLQEGRVDKQVQPEAAVESEIKAPLSRYEIEHMNSSFGAFSGGI